MIEGIFVISVLITIMYLENESKKLAVLEKSEKVLLVKPAIIPESNIYNNFSEWIEYIHNEVRVIEIKNGSEDIEIQNFLMKNNIMKRMP